MKAAITRHESSAGPCRHAAFAAHGAKATPDGLLGGVTQVVVALLPRSRRPQRMRQTTDMDV
jgi:hypothetical protein